MRRLHILLILLAVAVLLIPVRGCVRRKVVRAMALVHGRKTVADRLAQYGPRSRKRLVPGCAKVGVAYPPARLVLLGLKDERELQVYVGNADGALRHLRTYPIYAASGTLGPKLREGDHQVPEGIYGIESLNPNSRYQVSLRIGYPNAFDRRMGALEGRDDLGADIMIHGGASSVGCLAIGDEASAELFVLAADTGIRHVRVILSPVDFRQRQLPANHPPLPSWVDTLYADIATEVRQLPLPEARGRVSPLERSR